MSKTYYTLMIREEGQWSREFGDYDLETVDYELEDYRDHFKKRKDLRILKSLDTEASIQAAIAKFLSNQTKDI